MTAPLETDTYRDALLFLATAAVVVPVFRRLRISPILGFLLVGILLGPFGFGSLADSVSWLSVFTISNPEQVEQVGELGVVFLLFMVGLELSWERLVLMRRLVFGMGALQVGVSMAILAGIGYALGLSGSPALVLGGALALSSTAIIVPALVERRRLHSGAGRTSFAVLLFQDLAVAPLLIMVEVLAARGNGGFGFSGLLYALIPAVLVLVVVVGLGRLLIRPLFRHVAAAGSSELFMAACLLVIIGTGLATAAAGQSMGLGAFIAGLLLAETEFRREVEVLIDPFKGLLLGLFFLSVGVALDLSRVSGDPLGTVGLAVGLIAVKAAILLVLGRAFQLPRAIAREMSLVLAPGGEFGFVLIGAATAASIVPATVGATTTVAVTLSMFAIPVLARIGELIAGRSSGPKDLAGLAPPLDEGAGRVLIVGYGRVGRLVGEMLARHDIPYIAVDRDAAMVARERETGKLIYYGDATRPEFLRRCGLARARALVVTMDSSAATEQAIRAGRRIRPDLTIVARARDAEHARTLYRLGVTDAVPETIEASLQLSEAVLVDIGIAVGPVIASIHERRDEFRKLLQHPGSEDDASGPIRRSTRLGDRSRTAERN